MCPALKPNPEIVIIIHIGYVRKKTKKSKMISMCNITKLLSSKVGLIPKSLWV